MDYIRNVRDLVNIVEASKLKKDYNKRSVVTISYKLVKRKKIEESYYEEGNVIETSPNGVPEIDTAIRRDIFDYYDIKLTNTLNRLLGNFTYQTEVTDKVFKQRKYSIALYSTDMDEVVKAGVTDKGLNYLANTFKPIMSHEVGVGDEVIEYLIELFKQYDKTDTLPLVYIELFDFIPFESSVFNNQSLLDGDTLEVTDFNLLKIGNETIDRETIMLDSKTDNLFIIDKLTIDKHPTYTIKRIYSNDLFTNKLIK